MYILDIINFFTPEKKANIGDLDSVVDFNGLLSLAHRHFSISFLAKVKILVVVAENYQTVNYLVCTRYLWTKKIKWRSGLDDRGLGGTTPSAGLFGLRICYYHYVF